MKNFPNIDDIPVLCENVPDYRAEAFKQAKKDAKLFAVSYVLFNGLYYHVTSSPHASIRYQRNGYKLIHTERK